MAKITENEALDQIPAKVLQMYRAVVRLITEGAEPAKLRVSTITEAAEIGKGTAYEYFDSKEEIVVCAVAHQIQTMMAALEKELLRHRSFREQLEFLLEEISAQEEQNNCFFRLVHLVTDNSEFSRQIRQRLESDAFRQYSPVQMFRKVLGEAVERGELRGDLPLDYMVYTLGARLLGYMVAVSLGGLEMALSQMRELVYQGILDELCVSG